MVTKRKVNANELAASLLQAEFAEYGVATDVLQHQYLSGVIGRHGVDIVRKEITSALTGIQNREEMKTDREIQN